MARTLVKDAAAESDLITIWIDSFSQWNEAQADRYLSALELGIRKLVDDPKTGKPRDNLRPGYWSRRIEHHVAFYTFTDNELRIRRVLHEVMDPDLHLQPGRKRGREFWGTKRRQCDAAIQSIPHRDHTSRANSSRPFVQT
jgi:toxin ParE1/3/4